jgi:ferredoxin
MRAKVNPEICNGSGLCENTCPEVFELKEGISTVKVDEISAEAHEKCKQAAQECPTEAITIVE